MNWSECQGETREVLRIQRGTYVGSTHTYEYTARQGSELKKIYVRTEYKSMIELAGRG